MATLAWGIIGTGNIAATFAKGLLASKTSRLVAVASRTQDKADSFGKGKDSTDFLANHPVKRHPSYEALLADKDVQAVYIATPHPQHAEWAIKAAEARKHILCEKPLTLNHAEAMLVVNAARENKVFLMEAFMYRCHPLTEKIVELVKSKTIGEVRAIQCTFGFDLGTPNYERRLLKNSLGGGAILDVGCYTTSLARLVAGAALGKPFEEPADVKANGYLGPTGVDEWTFATLKFPGVDGPIIASLGTAVRCSMDNAIRIYGSAGNLLIPWLWIPAEKGAKITINRAGKPAEEITVDAPAGIYTLEADTAARAIAEGKLEAPYPAMTLADTLGNMKTLDAWRRSLGQIYDAEKPENQTTTGYNRPLKVRADAIMPFGKLEGLAKPVSRLIMGVDNQSIQNMPHASAMFDDFFERGGTTYDSAHVYGGGNCEKALGQWIKNRNLREKVVILGKGAHTPANTPEGLTRQLHESLDRYQTDYIDIYMMHRDNPDVPVGEFVTLLNEHVKAGRMKVFGVSNWTHQRVDAFIDYAKKNNLQSVAALSNNFSLARMVEAPWNGCLSSSSPDFLAWHRKTKFPLMSWSSQARGFFVHGDPNYTADPELVRSWYSPDNFQRLERAKELAKKKGVAPLQIALAYVLHQTFPTFALIGPRAIEETRTSFIGLKVQLTPEEVLWLNLEA